MKTKNFMSFIIAAGLVFTPSVTIAQENTDENGHAEAPKTGRSDSQNPSAKDLRDAVVEKITTAVNRGDVNWDEEQRLTYEVRGDGSLAQQLGNAIAEQYSDFNPQSQYFSSTKLSLTVTKEGKMIVSSGKRAYEFGQDGTVTRR